MSKIFSKLSQTHVFIQTDESGNGFNCKMLPVSALGEMNECSDLLGKANSVSDLESVRLRMIALVKTVMPEEYCDSLCRFDFAKLSELIAYLMYGDIDDQPRPKKN